MTPAQIESLVKSIKGDIEGISTKLEKRLDAIEVTGKDTSERVAVLDAAQKEISEAQAAMKSAIPARGGMRDVIFETTKKSGEKRAFLNEQMRFIAASDPADYDPDRANALSIQNGPSGGFAVPVEFDAEVHEKIERIAIMWPNSEVIPNAPVQGRGLIEAGDWTWGDAGEFTAPPETAFTDLLKEFTWGLKEKGALATISNHLMKAAAVDIAGMLSRKASKSLAKYQDTLFFNGNGSSEPAGVRIAQGVGTDTATATYEYDDLIDFEMTFPEEALQNMAMYLTKKTLKILAKLKDGNERPVLLNPLNAAQSGLTVDWQNYTGFINITRPYPFFLMTPAMIPENLGGGQNATELWGGPRGDYRIEDRGVMEASQDSTGTNWQKNQTQLKFLVAYDGRVMTPTYWTKQSGIIA
jgi:HK97 family phage major capsid protein